MTFSEWPYVADEGLMPVIIRKGAQIETSLWKFTIAFFSLENSNIQTFTTDFKLYSDHKSESSLQNEEKNVHHNLQQLTQQILGWETLSYVMFHRFLWYLKSHDASENDSYDAEL